MIEQEVCRWGKSRNTFMAELCQSKTFCWRVIAQWKSYDTRKMLLPVSHQPLHGVYLRSELWDILGGKYPQATEFTVPWWIKLGYRFRFRMFSSEEWKEARAFKKQTKNKHLEGKATPANGSKGRFRAVRVILIRTVRKEQRRTSNMNFQKSGRSTRIPESFFQSRASLTPGSKK